MSASRDMSPSRGPQAPVTSRRPPIVPPRIAVLAAIVLAVLLPLGCAGGPESAESASPGSATAPAASADPLDTLELTAPSTRPEIPPEALEPTEAGATAFVTYWFNALNYALENNDDEVLASHTAGSCAQCNAWVLVTAKNRSDGASMVGGLTAPVRLAIGPFSQMDPLPFRATFVSTGALVTGPDGSATSYPRLVGDGLITIQWSTDAQRWLMADVQLPPPSA